MYRKFFNVNFTYEVYVGNMQKKARERFLLPGWGSSCRFDVFILSVLEEDKVKIRGVEAALFSLTRRKKMLRRTPGKVRGGWCIDTLLDVSWFSFGDRRVNAAIVILSRKYAVSLMGIVGTANSSVSLTKLLQYLFWRVREGLVCIFIWLTNSPSKNFIRYWHPFVNYRYLNICMTNYLELTLKYYVLWKLIC